MNKYIKISEFSYSWRFTDSNYCELSEYELSRLLPLNSENSMELWENIISNHIDSFVQIRNKLKLQPFINNCNWNSNEDVTSTKLKEYFNLGDKEKIIIFWGKNTAVETDWSLFLEHWSDFCYPSDDGIVLVNENSKPFLHYSEDIFYNILDFKSI